MRNTWLACLGAALLGALALWYGHGRQELNSVRQIIEFRQTLENVQRDLAGTTRTTDYVAQGKRALRERTELVTASITRNDSLMRQLHKEVLVFSSDATVVVNYSAQYLFGYDFKPGHYDIVASPSGIEIRVQRPVLIGSPAILSQNHAIPSAGLLIDEKAAVLRLVESLPQEVDKQGRALAASPEIQALCEKNLVAFMKDFYSKQPGMRRVPEITVTTIEQAPATGAFLN